MPVEILYHVCVVDSAGALRLRKVQASSESDAKSMALRDAVRIVSCTALAATPLSPGRWLTLGWRSHRLMEPISFAQDMATLLGAGVTIKDTLQALQQREAEAQRRQLLTRLADQFSDRVRSVITRSAQAAQGMQGSVQTLTSTADQTATQTAGASGAASMASGSVETVAAAAEELSASIK